MGHRAVETRRHVILPITDGHIGNRAARISGTVKHRGITTVASQGNHRFAQVELSIMDKGFWVDAVHTQVQTAEVYGYSGIADIDNVNMSTLAIQDQDITL